MFPVSLAASLILITLLLLLILALSSSSTQPLDTGNLLGLVPVFPPYILIHSHGLNAICILEALKFVSVSQTALLSSRARSQVPCKHLHLGISEAPKT